MEKEGNRDGLEAQKGWKRGQKERRRDGQELEQG